MPYLGHKATKLDFSNYRVRHSDDQNTILFDRVENIERETSKCAPA